MGIVFDTEEILHEKYFGSARNAKQIEKAISESRKKYIGVSKIRSGFYGDKSFVPIENAIKNVFGFNIVDFDLTTDPAYNAYTYPLASSMSSALITNYDPIKATKENYYDGNGICLYVRVTTGLYTSPEFTDEEITAIILHEIGHNFQHVNNSKLKLFGQIQAVASIICLFGGGADGVMTDSTIRTRAAKIMKESPFFKNIIGIFGGISGILKYIGNSIYAVLNFVTLGIPNTLFSGLRLSMSSIFSFLGSGINKGEEFNSDAFAANFGYGAPLTSALLKMETTTDKFTGTGIEKSLNKIPVLSSIQNAMSIPAAIAMAPISSHPITSRRINNIISELEMQLKKSDVSPAMKKEIQHHIADCKEMAKYYTEPKGDSRDVNRKWLASIIKRGKTTGPISNLFATNDIDVKESASNIDIEDELECILSDYDSLDSVELSKEESIAISNISKLSDMIMEYTDYVEY